ncbi:hypothetical protein [Paremcibacter congregatus]|uniref:TfoX N-terminal domain-containing protein n=1 Tax=Paremcibacter congregatus TaxID=2043170 RepID=A0A2G4YNG8_9PROT|nr:hypothetical protein [Paremcibacter congregatus]PHZ83871.1 hypothetical protein CRD36_16105 [Paremcibacter congregatus]QDE27576.1 hypothetical protein FIV45_09940 [Paremcibacter congregatus]
MAFNQDVADRLMPIMANIPSTEETRMFGGFSYSLHGNMRAGINQCDLIVRLGVDKFELLSKKYGD